MELNVNYVRDILLYLENKIGVKRKGTPPEFRLVPVTLIEMLDSEELSKIPGEDITYTLLKLNEAKYIIITDKTPVAGRGISNFSVIDITYKGHKFLNTIKPDTIWEKTQKTIGKVGNHTLEYAEDVAKTIAVETAKIATMTYFNKTGQA